jgi:glycosyltransferase involved in cell wall biosynthesis
MRFLMVADSYPWPPTTGSHLRLANTLTALAGRADTDLFCLYDARQAQDPVPTELGLAGVRMVPLGPVRETPVRRFLCLARRDLPIEVALRNGNSNPRETFDAWRQPAYDLVWFRSPATYQWLGRPRLGPTVVDVDDLADVKEHQRAALLRSRPVAGVASRARRAAAVAQATLNARDWARFECSVASEVDRVVLASEADVPLLAGGNCEVLPNTYERPEHPLGRIEPRQPPTLLFQGTFDYGPNVDGARWLVRDLAPQIRERLPDARIRLVGKTTGSVDELADPPRVTVVGRVPRMEPELAGADLVVVPLRMGSGTRFKILEAFAHRIPVVSTRLGAEGLAVEDGVHLLVADHPEAFADACARLSTDAALRRRLVDSAERLFEERYESAAARSRVHDIVSSLTGVAR